MGKSMKLLRNSKGQFIRIKTQEDYMFLFQMQDKYIQDLFNRVTTLEKTLLTNSELKQEWKGEFAPNLGHDPYNPFPFPTNTKEELWEKIMDILEEHDAALPIQATNKLLALLVK